MIAHCTPPAEFDLASGADRTPCAPGDASCSFQTRAFDALTATDLQKWQVLAGRAIEPNPFQEPQFVQASRSTLCSADDLQLLTVTDLHSGDWIAAWTVQSFPASLSRPLPHLRSLATPYTFADCPLIDRDHAIRAIAALSDALSKQRRWHGVRLRMLATDGELARCLQSCRDNGLLTIMTDRQWNRAQTDLASLGGQSLVERASRSRRKSLNRARRWLQSQGSVQHRLIHPSPDDSRPVDEFLRLEAMGWKGELGTAINSRPEDSCFFRSMVASFARTRQVAFGELLLDGRAVASTCNLIYGGVMFAFKLGWDPEFARGNLGHWAEIELADAVRSERPDVARIDSCSAPGSYVESVSTGSRPMASSVLVWSRRAQALCHVRRQYQSLKSTVLRSARPAHATDRLERASEEETS